jgi:flagellar hook protein FlgE
MLRSLNSGVSGLRAFQTKLDVIGNNIANVNTVGFKRGRVVFEDIFSQTVKNSTAPSNVAGGSNPLQVGLGTKVASVDNLFTPGSPTTTNNPNDLYIDGNGFFQVQKNGATYLTRAGSFNLDSNGQLVNPDGAILMDNAATPKPITLPPGSVSFSVDATGNVTGLDVDGNPVGTPITIGLVTVNNPGGLKKVGGSLYSTTTNSGQPTVSNSQIISGALEMSNVDLSEELTDMITAQRGFQANAKIITVSDSVLEELVNLKR